MTLGLTLDLTLDLALDLTLEHGPVPAGLRLKTGL